MTARALSVWVVCLVAIASGCASGRGPGSNRRPTDIVMTPTGYCEVVAAPGLLDWSGNTATVCPDGIPEGEGGDVEIGASCQVVSVDANGAMVPTGITGAQSAQALGDGRYLVWGWDGRLTLDNGRGSVTEIAPVALGPYLDPATRRVTFVAPLTVGEGPATGTLEPGDDREVVLYDIATNTSVSLVTDITASAPIPIPGTNDALYVSTASGVAQIVRVTPTETIVLTNRDATGVEQEFVPVYSRQVLFTDGGDFLVFTAEYETDVLWRLNLSTGDAEELGPGSYPAFGNDGSVLAGNASSGGDCASRYLDGRP